MKRRFSSIIILGLVAVLLISACGPAATPAPTQDPATIQTEAVQTAIADMTASAPTAEPPAATEPPPAEATPVENIPVAVLPTPAPGDPAAVANFNTTIYSGPGTNYVVYGSLLGGRAVQVTGISEDSRWWVINVPPAPNGQGWVAASAVNASNVGSMPVVPTPPVPPTVGVTPPGPSDPQLIVLVNAQVRTGPGSNYPALGIAPAGITVRVIGKSEDGEWWVIRINPELVGAGFGWILGEVTQASNVENVQTIANPTVPATIPPTAPPAGAPSATALDFVNVRSGPGTNFPVLGVAAPGATAEVSGRSADGGWWQVIIPASFASGGFGWVSASWVSTQNTQNVPVVASPPPPPVTPTQAPGATGACTVVSLTPANGTAFGQGAAFTTTWVLQNTSGSNWMLGEYDLRFVSATNNTRLHQGADVYDINSRVDAGWTYNFSLSMIAPFSTGTFGETWEVIRGNQTICQFSMSIQVR